MYISLGLLALYTELTVGHSVGHQHQHVKRANDAVSVSAPATVPADASPNIDPSFPGFAFEETSLPQYAGDPGKPNQFSVNLLNAIASRTNTKPSIRVSGTSLDQSKYVPSQKVAVKFPPNQNATNVPTNVTLGPAYFQSFKNFPTAEYIFGLQLAANNLTNTVEFAKAGIPVVQPQVAALEIGNEPQFYPGTVRPASYSPEDYIRQFTRFSNAINKALGISNNARIYEGIALGSPSIFEQTDQAAAPGPFYPISLFRKGLRDLAPRFQSVALHYYQTQGDDPNPTMQLRNELLNHTITTRKTDFFKPAIQHFRTYFPNIPVRLAEVASSLNGARNDYGLEQVFGAALWQVDWMLYCAYIGINRINWQQISASAFDLWQPVVYKGRQPGVLPPFYAMVFVADFIGKDGGVRIDNIDLGREKLTAYAAYGAEPNQLKRLALVNMQFFSGVESATNTRSTVDFKLRLPTTAKTVTVEKLSAVRGATANTGPAGGGDEKSGITWAGEEWTYENNGVGQIIKSDTASLSVVNGKVTVPIRASEAVQVLVKY